VKWVPPKNIHLTLKFLGKIPVEQILGLNQVIQALSEKLDPIEIALTEIKIFPSPSRPKGIWAAIKSSHQLLLFQKLLEEQLSEIGYRPERNAFSPHLTLGRFRRGAKLENSLALEDFLKSQDLKDFQELNLGELVLYKSDLFPTGAVYTKLFSTLLGI
jgi:2'-5' RNA ligase